MTARAPAKVNLQLAVGPVRADGYHDVVTVYHAVSLFDEVTVLPADRSPAGRPAADRPAAGPGTVTVTGEGVGSVPVDGDNLAARAAEALWRAVARGHGRSPRLAIRISKRIPVAAGLAGGSADAAATLVACNELWGAGLSHAELSELASGLGSDVAFALLGGTAVGVGRGERVTPALASGIYHWVLAFAAGELSTAQVYAAHDRALASRSGAGTSAGTIALGATVAGGGTGGAGRPRAGDAVDGRLMAALRSGNPAELGPLLSNDLQAAAISLYPGLRRTLEAGAELGALGAIVSGSGPACAYLAKDARHARDLAAALAGAGVCRTVAHVTGPAPGATIVSNSPEPE